VAYLDVDYHHCNGTQSLFYERDDVLTTSIHCDPRYDYPYFSGFADERGADAGVGYNLNLPLPPGTRWSHYRPALESAVETVKRFAPEALVVLLGVDTYKDDKISQFALELDDLGRIGKTIAGLRLPTVFVKGGGYCEEALDRGVTSLLAGYLGA
jgi:acetoin utilization deacetylase AcuC-like enzyme